MCVVAAHESHFGALKQLAGLQEFTVVVNLSCPTTCPLLVIPITELSRYYFLGLDMFAQILQGK